MKQLDEFIGNLRHKLLKNLVCVAIFGSKANYGIQKIKSNVDLIIVLEDITFEKLTVISPYIMKWVNAGNRYPVIITRDEMKRSNDVFAVELFDIQWNYQVIYGEDVIKINNVGYNNLRDQCIRELKILIFKFRNYYTTYYKDKNKIKKELICLISKCLVLFRAILRLQNITPSVYKNDLIEQFSGIIHIDKRLFKHLVGQKEHTYDIPKYAIDDCAVLVYNELKKILDQIQAM